MKDALGARGGPAALDLLGVEESVQVGQFPSTGEHYGLLFQKGNKLVGCVNSAIKALKSNGTLASLQTKWLSIYTSVPVIEP